jgi:hypothetical protein
VSARVPGGRPRDRRRAQSLVAAAVGESVDPGRPQPRSDSVRPDDRERVTAGDDPRLELIYREALRGLVQQQTLVESMNARAGNLIFATAFASSLLGGRALSDGLGIWDWIAVTLLLALGVQIVALLWPYYQYRFRFDPEDLLRQYVDGPTPASMSEMYREQALRMEEDRKSNWRIIQRLRIALQLALIFLVLEILAWLFAIAWV